MNLMANAKVPGIGILVAVCPDRMSLHQFSERLLRDDSAWRRAEYRVLPDSLAHRIDPDPLFDTGIGICLVQHL
jgi:hypothetical protein